MIRPLRWNVVLIRNLTGGIVGWRVGRCQTPRGREETFDCVARPLHVAAAGGVKQRAAAWKHLIRRARVPLADPRVVCLDEPSGLAPAFKSLMQSSYSAHKQWTDTDLAAFAECLSWEVVTFDTGFIPHTVKNETLYV